MNTVNVFKNSVFTQLIAAGLLLVSFSTHAAVDMFFKIEGVDGESKDHEFPDSIDILSWSEGLSQSGSLHVGTGGATGKVSVQDMSITKYIDRSSPELRLALAQGKIYPTAELIVRKAGESPLVFFKIKFTKILISSISAGGSGGEDRLTENVTVNFEKVEWTYTPQKDDGSGDAEIMKCWDVAANVQC